MNNFLTALLSKVQLNNERVIEVLNIITGENTDEVLRIMAYLSEAENKPEIPQEIQNETLRVKMTAYDIVNNRVNYTGLTLDNIYVQDEVTAAQIKGKISGEEIDLNEIKTRGWKNDEYPFKTAVWMKTNTSMPLSSWLEKAK